MTQLVLTSAWTTRFVLTKSKNWLNEKWRTLCAIFFALPLVLITPTLRLSERTARHIDYRLTTKNHPDESERLFMTS